VTVYRVENSTNPGGGNFQFIGQVSAPPFDASTFLKQRKTYFRVRAVNANGMGPASTNLLIQK